MEPMAAGYLATQQVYITQAKQDAQKQADASLINRSNERTQTSSADPEKVLREAQHYEKTQYDATRNYLSAELRKMHFTVTWNNEHKFEASEMIPVWHAGSDGMETGDVKSPRQLFEWILQRFVEGASFARTHFVLALKQAHGDALMDMCHHGQHGWFLCASLEPI